MKEGGRRIGAGCSSRREERKGRVVGGAFVIIISALQRAVSSIVPYPSIMKTRPGGSTPSKWLSGVLCALRVPCSWVVLT